MQALQKLKVLFLCTGNSCRSQIAEAWTRHFWSDSIQAYSAGIEVHGLNPRAVQVMNQAGVDISGQRSKHLDQLKDIDFDYVITLCDKASQSCPVFPDKTTVIHAGFPDPARVTGAEREILSVFCRLRDQIKTFIEYLPDLLQKQERKD